MVNKKYFIYEFLNDLFNNLERKQIGISIYFKIIKIVKICLFIFKWGV